MFPMVPVRTDLFAERRGHRFHSISDRISYSRSNQPKSKKDEGLRECQCSIANKTLSYDRKGAQHALCKRALQGADGV